MRRRPCRTDDFPWTPTSFRFSRRRGRRRRCTHPGSARGRRRRDADARRGGLVRRGLRFGDRGRRARLRHAVPRRDHAHNPNRRARGEEPRSARGRERDAFRRYDGVRPRGGARERRSDVAHARPGDGPVGGRRSVELRICGRAGARRRRRGGLAHRQRDAGSPLPVGSGPRRRRAAVGRPAVLRPCAGRGRRMARCRRVLGVRRIARGSERAGRAALPCWNANRRARPESMLRHGARGRVLGPARLRGEPGRTPPSHWPGCSRPPCGSRAHRGCSSQPRDQEPPSP